VGHNKQEERGGGKEEEGGGGGEEEDNDEGISIQAIFTSAARSLPFTLHTF